MTFLNPLLLTAASAILIPIFLHFFFRRKKKIIYFSSIRFLKEIEKKQIIKNTWLEWLLLALRVLTILFIVIAFSYPSGKNNLIFSINEKHSTFIYVDHNYYLKINEKEINLKEKLLNELRTYLKQDNIGDIYWISPSDYSFIKIKNQDLINKLAELDYYYPRETNYDLLAPRIKNYTEKNKIETYRSAIFTINKVKKTEYFEIISPTIKKDLKNISIKNARIKESIRSPETKLHLIIDFNTYNFSTDPEVLITINNKTFYNKIININNKQLQVPLGKFNENNYNVTIEILDQDAYKEDNIYHLNFDIKKKRHALVLAKNQKSIIYKYFNNFPDSTIEVLTDLSFNSLRYQFSAFNSVFIELSSLKNSELDQIHRFSEEKNGNIVLFPDSTFDYLSWNKSKLSKYLKFQNFEKLSFTLNEREISNIFLPKKNKKAEEIEDIIINQRWKANTGGWTKLLGNGRRTILANKDQIYIFLSPLDQNASNIIYHPLMPNILYQLLYGNIERLSYDEGKSRLTFTNKHPAKSLELTHLNNSKKYILEVQKSKIGKSYYTIPDNFDNGHYNFAIEDLNLYFSYNSKKADFNRINFEGEKKLKKENQFADINFNYWRFFIFLALITYLLEFIIGQIAVKQYEK